ncbi:hypothetical protein EEL30_00160 (plasmid) [Brevibacillus laterosporus]|uniref:Uncharacterized protein n=1 Tax=Brevibacillus laterosporus TaxID=1465 RepID=A0A518V1S8_BRELA|nr:hypothetical protein EEL30_00160 [Brevibacillus laterosporus]
MDLYFWESLLIAPHTGAWIETSLQNHRQSPIFIAPYTGVWIETMQTNTITASILSLFTRECGLKRSPSILKAWQYIALYARAWIETFLPNDQALRLLTSLLTQERGLKRKHQ